jgi:hypothetical protein
VHKVGSGLAGDDSNFGHASKIGCEGDKFLWRLLQNTAYFYRDLLRDETFTKGDLAHLGCCTIA